MNKINKQIIGIASIVVLLCICVSFPVSARIRFMTKGKFASLVIRMMDLESMLPADKRVMSLEEFYQAEIELLSTRGIYTFLGSKPNELVKRKDLVDFLFTALVANNIKRREKAVTDAEKFSFLVKKGYLKRGKLDRYISEEEIIKTLNIPNIAKAITTNYISPGSAEQIAEFKLPKALEMAYEEPASPIY